MELQQLNKIILKEEEKLREYKSKINELMSINNKSMDQIRELEYLLGKTKSATEILNGLRREVHHSHIKEMSVQRNTENAIY